MTDFHLYYPARRAATAYLRRRAGDRRAPYPPRRTDYQFFYLLARFSRSRFSRTAKNPHQVLRHSPHGEASRDRNIVVTTGAGNFVGIVLATHPRASVAHRLKE